MLELLLSLLAAGYPLLPPVLPIERSPTLVSAKTRAKVRTRTVLLVCSAFSRLVREFEKFRRHLATLLLHNERTHKSSTAHSSIANRQAPSTHNENIK